jgi:hypothetical protein
VRRDLGCGHWTVLAGALRRRESLPGLVPGQWYEPAGMGKASPLKTLALIPVAGIFPSSVIR